MNVFLAPSIPTLPTALIDIKLKLSATRKRPVVAVNGEYQVTDQVIKAETIEFSDNGVLVFESLDFEWVVFYADVLKLNGTTTIKRTDKIDLTGKHGADGAHGRPPAKGYGRHGNPGQPGGWGYPGGSQSVPNLYVFCQEVLWQGQAATPSDVKGNVTLEFSGYPGGRGGNGGNGGDGSKGSDGKPSQDGLLDCKAGPGKGGNGGNAGAAGIPGMGGDGTDGAIIEIFVRPSQVPIFQALSYSVAKGRPGRFGKYGSPGTPGLGGKEGKLSANCGKAGRDGKKGAIPEICKLPDTTAVSGTDGPAPTVTPYTGFNELLHPDD
ncbi:hypothetical protein [Ensifer aridi]|uniref:hypothetical protein n=1 Tax=Ensifer aridi TaxID=1708715 RepID=UPI00047C83E4|nr:hypothetical protein [Ensifer aridi]